MRPPSRPHLAPAALALACVAAATAAPTTLTVSVPAFTVGGVAIRDANASIRDPCMPLRDPATGVWHMYATYLEGPEAREGYSGRIHHFTADDPLGQWTDAGIVVDVGAPNTFDAYGVFTPGAAYEPATEEWLLWFGGVADNGPAHDEAVGLATAPAPGGPFTKRNGGAPVLTKATASWCGAAAARVDEVHPFEYDPAAHGFPTAGAAAAAAALPVEKLILNKAVCNNFTALPSVLRGAGGTYLPPYVVDAARTPMVRASHTLGKLGFEEPILFNAPDGYLHLYGHDHDHTRGSRYVHFIAATPDLTRWVEVPPPTGKIFEPVPRFPLAAPGSRAGVPDHWVDFYVNGETPMEVRHMHVTWTTVNVTVDL